MKWTYAVFTKPFNYTNAIGVNTVNVGRMIEARFPNYLTKDGLVVEGYVAYKIRTLIPNEYFTLVDGKEEAKAFAATLKA